MVIFLHLPGTSKTSEMVGPFWEYCTGFCDIPILSKQQFPFKTPVAAFLAVSGSL